MGTQIEDREGARRQHRMIGLFAVLQCWRRQLDGVVIEHSDLLRLIGLNVIKPKRAEWIKEDLKSFFPYIEAKWPTRQFIGKFWLSRVPFERDALARTSKIQQFHLWDDVKLETLSKHEIFSPFLPQAGSANIDERLLTSYLTLLAQGQIPLDSIPPLEMSFAMVGGE